MSKKINFSLSASSVEKAVKEIEKYKQDLNRKIERFCKALLDFGKVTAVQHSSLSPLGKTITVSTSISVKSTGCKAMLIGVGQTKESNGYSSVNTLLLVEFGSGIRYNSVENPKAGEFGMGVGSFPGQIHAFDPNGWYYLGDDDEWHHSYGVKATMPMYNAGKAMREQIVNLAREAFLN